jgi:hypothetical protein
VVEGEGEGELTRLMGGRRRFANAWSYLSLVTKNTNLVTLGNNWNILLGEDLPLMFSQTNWKLRVLLHPGGPVIINGIPFVIQTMLQNKFSRRASVGAIPFGMFIPKNTLHGIRRKRRRVCFRLKAELTSKKKIIKNEKIA